LRLAFEGEAKSSKLKRLLVSGAFSNDLALMESYELEELAQYLDFFIVKTLDFVDAGSKTLGHNSPLFPIEQGASAVSTIVEYYSKNGAPSEKIVISLPTYGRSFNLKSLDKFDIGAEVSSAGTGGKITKTKGFLSYGEICQWLSGENVTLVWDNEEGVPFAYSSDGIWVGFDDERSLQGKVAWLKEQGLGGVNVQSLEFDDFTGKSCGAGKFPLLKAINKELQDYRVPLVYDGPYEGSSTGANKKKDPNEVTCSEEDGHISYHIDHADCTKYYMCEGERKHHMPCPAQLVFNDNENVCDWPERVERCKHLAAKVE